MKTLLGMTVVEWACAAVMVLGLLFLTSQLVCNESGLPLPPGVLELSEVPR